VKRPTCILAHDDGGSSTHNVPEAQQYASASASASDCHERSHPVTPQSETEKQPSPKISSLLAAGVGSWTAEQHRDFAAAVFLAGMRTSSPAVILDSLQRSTSEPNPEASTTILSPATITSANVKSHLQKYRKNKEKNMKDFMEAYDNWMQTVKTLTSNLNVPRNNNCTVNTLRALNANIVFQLRELMNPEILGPGEMAAYLSFRAMMHQKKRFKASARETAASNTTPQAAKPCHKPGDQTLEKHLAYESVSYPKLTEAEKSSPIGMGLEFTKKLMSTINAQVENERRAQFGLPPSSDDEDFKQGVPQRQRSMSFSSQTYHDLYRLPVPWGSPPSYPSNNPFPKTDSYSDISLSPQAMRALYIPPPIHQENGSLGSHNHYNQFPSRKRFREDPSHFDLDDDLSLSTTLTGEDARDHTLLTEMYDGDGSNHHHRTIRVTGQYARDHTLLTDLRDGDGRNHHHRTIRVSGQYARDHTLLTELHDGDGRNHHHRTISVSRQFADSYFGVDARVAYDHVVYSDHH
jgi:hypothetical protein